MDGSFACPECGSDVEVRGLAPGRQVRCRVLPPTAGGPVPSAGGRPVVEAPSLRTSEMGSLGLGRAWAFSWSWSWRLGSSRSCGGSMIRSRIGRSISCSRRRKQHEADGRLGEALIDLDAALELADKAGLGLGQAERGRPDTASGTCEARRGGRAGRTLRQLSHRRSGWETGST